MALSMCPIRKKYKGNMPHFKFYFFLHNPTCPLIYCTFFFQPQQRNVPLDIFQTVLRKACVRLDVICLNKYQHRLFKSTQLVQAILHTYYQLAFKASRNEEEFMLDTGKEKMQKYQLEGADFIRMKLIKQSTYRVEQ